MLTVYLSCLVVGGVFVALSATGAFGKDIDAEHGLDAPALEASPEVEHEISLGEATQALTTHPGSRKTRLWLPVLSLRFWTWGAAFFGLMGALLSTLTSASALFTGLVSAVTGIGVGSLSAWVVRVLRNPVGAQVRLADYRGQVGELMLPLRAGGVTRIRLRVHERERTMLAVTSDPVALAAGTRVLVLGIDERGRAQIEPEDSPLGPDGP